MAKEKKTRVQKSQKNKSKIHWGKIFWYAFLGFIIILFIINNTRKDDSLSFQYPPGTKKYLHETKSSDALAFDFSLKSIDGSIVKLSDFKGKVVVLDFWATWCAPCRKGIPDLIDIQKSFGNNIQVIGITVDQDPTKVVPPFVKEYKINYPILIGNDDVYNKYDGIDAIPTTFIIDKSGRIINKYIGLVEKQILINEIKQALGS
ncbi:MAG: TlpA family protein disulfide reductase [Ignavibacteria bacterium]